MPTLRIRISKEELALFKNYAKRRGKTLRQTIRAIMLERIEDEYDLRVFAQFEREESSGSADLKPIQELWDALDRCEHLPQHPKNTQKSGSRTEETLDPNQVISPCGQSAGAKRG